jgi:hypothetical protein
LNINGKADAIDVKEVIGFLSLLALSGWDE